MTPAKPMKSKTDDNSDSSNSAALWGSLTGLALTGCCIWGIVSGHSTGSRQISAATENLSQSADILLEKISKLRKLIFEDYTHRRNRIVQNLNRFDEFDYKIPFKNGKTLQAKISKLENEYSEINEIYKNNVSENSKIIKQKIKELSTDTEWKDLRKLRKQFIKIMQTPSAGEQRQIASEKITFINDLLITKVYPQDSAKYNLYGITEQQAMELVKKDFKTYEEFTNYYDSIKNNDIPFHFEEIGNRFFHNGTLSLADVFPEEMGAIKNSAKLREETFSKLTAAKSLFQKYLDSMKQLATEYRQTDGIKELKTLLRNLHAIKQMAEK